jgi:hypothetical protein
VDNALVNAMAFFIWRQTRFPHYLARLQPDRSGRSCQHRARLSACVSGLTKAEAEDLLDWLEATGRHQRKLIYIRGQGFSVSFS